MDDTLALTQQFYAEGVVHAQPRVSSRSERHPGRASKFSERCKRSTCGVFPLGRVIDRRTVSVELFQSSKLSILPGVAPASQADPGLGMCNAFGVVGESVPVN
jgi:hypothetical protein